jgi:hypothetical protein
MTQRVMNEDPAEAFLGFVCASMWRDRVAALPGRPLTDPEGLETRRGAPLGPFLF